MCIAIGPFVEASTPEQSWPGHVCSQGLKSCGERTSGKSPVQSAPSESKMWLYTVRKLVSFAAPLLVQNSATYVVRGRLGILSACTYCRIWKTKQKYQQPLPRNGSTLMGATWGNGLPSSNGSGDPPIEHDGRISQNHGLRSDMLFFSGIRPCLFRSRTI